MAPGLLVPPLSRRCNAEAGQNAPVGLRWIFGLLEKGLGFFGRTDLQREQAAFDEKATVGRRRLGNGGIDQIETPSSYRRHGAGVRASVKTLAAGVVLA